MTKKNKNDSRVAQGASPLVVKKRTYVTPKSTPWGTVVELTEGAGGPISDFPAAGSKNA